MAKKKEKPAKKAPGKKVEAAKVSKAEDQNLIGALCYIPFMWIGIIASLFILLTENKENKFLKFHATQALLFYIISIFFFLGLMICGWIIGIIAAVFTYGLGGLCVGLFVALVAIVWIAFMFFAAWKAFNGEEYEIPFVGKVARTHL